MFIVAPVSTKQENDPVGVSKQSTLTIRTRGIRLRLAITDCSAIPASSGGMTSSSSGASIGLATNSKQAVSMKLYKDSLVLSRLNLSKDRPTAVQSRFRDCLSRFWLRFSGRSGFSSAGSPVRAEFPYLVLCKWSRKGPGRYCGLFWSRGAADVADGRRDSICDKYKDSNFRRVSSICVLVPLSIIE